MELKVGIIGLNGIGSFLVRSLSEDIQRGIRGISRIDPFALTLFDYDTVEEKNYAYTLYDVNHIGKKKTEVLHNLYSFKVREEKIEKVEQLAGFDFLILCVDNNEVRKVVYESDIPFLDLRAKGRAIAIFLGKKEYDNEGRYLDLTLDDGRKGGCQYRRDLESKDIQFGNRIVAEWGLQVLKDYLKGDIKVHEKVMMV